MRRRLGSGNWFFDTNGQWDILTFDTDPNAINMSFNVRVFLEGAYNQQTPGLMTTNLQDFLPQTQPYQVSLPYFGNDNPLWLYQGNEQVIDLPPNVVDWVLVELRDATSAQMASPETAIAKKAAFLMNDGYIKTLDGAGFLQIEASYNHDLYLLIHHRNHLSIMSSNPVLPDNGLYSYDFTTGADRVYGGENSYKFLGNGFWGMAGGDGDANGQIQNQDKNNVWKPQFNENGYKAGDYILNGQVQNQDKTEAWQLNSGKGSGLPDNLEKDK